MDSKRPDLRNSYGRVLPPLWDEVWIVGGGPSRKKFDFSRLTGSHVLAINEMAPRLFSSDHQFRKQSFFSLDSAWVARNRDYLGEFAGEKYVSLPLETFPECADIPGVVYLEWCHEEGLSENSRKICTGCNSGYGAINLAFLKQARFIHLVGFDMDPVHHDAYSFWSVLFRDTLPQLARNGIQVLNHNPDSFIDAYPKVPRRL